jgi:hypothetical protein
MINKETAEAQFLVFGHLLAEYFNMENPIQSDENGLFAEISTSKGGLLLELDYKTGNVMAIAVIGQYTPMQANIISQTDFSDVDVKIRNDFHRDLQYVYVEIGTEGHLGIHATIELPLSVGLSLANEDIANILNLSEAIRLCFTK